MFYLKSLFAIFILAIANTLSDNIFMHFGIPITSQDIVFTLGSLLAIHCWFKVNLGELMGDSVAHLSWFKLIGSVMVTLFCFALGVVFTYYGFKYPLMFMEGRRGSTGHGYSMAAFGVATLLFSTTLLYFTLSKRLKARHNKTR
uniref:Transmembrane protein n=2 Tax=Gammaproteobacteria TaxID=1236 RepID=A6VZD3_MARMS